MHEPLLVVDVQVCFVNEYTSHIPGRIAALIALEEFDPLIFTRFVNAPNSPYRRLLDWHGCEEEEDTVLAEEIRDLADRGLTFVKAGYTGLSDELREYLRESGIKRLSIAGIDTDMCVLKIAMDVFDLGIEPIVFSDCCASTAGLQSHLAGLAILSRNIGPHQLRPSGLGGSELAAPQPPRS